MKWVKWGNYAIKAEGHSISKAMVNGKWIYTVWQLPAKFIGNYGNANDAKAKVVEIIANKPAKSDSIASDIRQQEKLGNTYTRK